MVPVLRALLRSRVALAPEILYFAPLSIVTRRVSEQTPLTKFHDVSKDQYYLFDPSVGTWQHVRGSDRQHTAA